MRVRPTRSPAWHRLRQLGAEGKVTRNAQLRLVRDGIVIHEGEIALLQLQGQRRRLPPVTECGITLEKFSDLKVGDVLECFEMQEIERYFPENPRGFLQGDCNYFPKPTSAGGAGNSVKYMAQNAEFHSAFCAFF